MKPKLLAVVTATALAFAGSLASAATYNFTPIAGEPALLDHLDGTNTAARFLNPVAVAIAADGTVYVADSGDHTVRKIDAAGNSSVFAGASGVVGNVDGAATSARFGYPYAVAVGPDGSIYVADTLTNSVRKISGGQVSTIATGLNGPQGVAVDSLGHVFISDTNNSVIKEIVSPGSAVTVFAGSTTGVAGAADGQGAAALFNFPAGLATDSANNVYVADFDNSAIRMITPGGNVTTLAGSLGNPGHANATSGGSATFNHPQAVAVDANNNVYVVDTSNQLIRVISATAPHQVTTAAGTYNATLNQGVIGKADGPATTATFFYPQGITVNSAGTAIYIADTGNHTVRSLTGTNLATAGGTVGTFAGSVGTAGSANGGASSATFRAPYGVAVDGAGNVFIADAGNNLIRELSNGTVTTLAGTGVAGGANGASGIATFSNPSGVAVDKQGNVFVVDTGNNAVRKIAAGIVSTVAGGYNSPQGIATDATGNVYVADTNNNVVAEIPAGTATSSVIASGFNKPNAVAVDSSGNVYVSDFGNSQIKMIAVGTHAVSTLAGATGQVGYADATGNAARFNQTYGIAVDTSGNVYVTDTLNRVVRQIASGGVVTTVTGNQSRFFYPEGIALDANNNMIVVDADNNSLSEAAAPASVTGGGLANHTVAPGGTATFSVISPVPGASYTWQVSTDGVNWMAVSNSSVYSGAATSSLVITGAATSMNGYEYRALANGSAGPTGFLYVGTVRLLNLSSSGFVGTGASNLNAGFIINGGSKSILLRGIGPSLAQFTGSSTLATPMLILDSGAAGQQTNTVWGGTAALTNAMAATGAFTLSPTSADSAILTSLIGSHTAIVQSASTSTGPALVEVYDADQGTPTSRLINISTRAVVGTANLVAGFVIGGTTSETVLIRGIGPGLVPFGVTNTVSAVVLTVNDGHATQIAQNTGWSSGSNATQLANTFTQVGAFTLTQGSGDAAMLLTLAPGSYTATVTGAGSAAGAAMVEIYEVP